MLRTPTGDDADDEQLEPEPLSVAMRDPTVPLFPLPTGPSGPTSRAGPRTGELPVPPGADDLDRAFAVIHERMFPLLVRKAVVVLGPNSFDAAEDVAQLAIIGLWEKCVAGEPGTPLPRDLPRVQAYLFSAANNLALNEIRRRSRLVANADGIGAELLGVVRRWMDPLESVLADEVERFLHRTLRKMPEKRREAWMRVEWFGGRYPDVARELDVSETTVRSHVSLAWKTIAKAARKTRVPPIFRRFTRRP